MTWASLPIWGKAADKYVNSETATLICFKSSQRERETAKRDSLIGLNSRGAGWETTRDNKTIKTLFCL